MLRSLKDVNLPKFLAPDIPLFEGILSDLFPGVVLPPTNYDDMTKSALKVCTNMNLQVSLGTLPFAANRPTRGELFLP